MFERNKVDNSLQLAAVPAELTLDDGTVLKGKFLVNAARSLHEILNGPGAFMDFETYGGERALLAKSRFASVKIKHAPSAATLGIKARDADGFDPHGILGVTRDSPWEKVRGNYLELSKTYHPDRFAGVALPPEVTHYLATMARRVNAAYAALEVPAVAARRSQTEKAKPIFTSPTRM